MDESGHGKSKDVLYGGDGDDIYMLYGGPGEDVLYGGDGNDFLHASSDGQRDRLYCGRGKDEYAADKVDHVSSSCEKKVNMVQVD